MRVLLLGGTAFLGRAVARHALDAGHEVVCLARGSAPVAEGATLVRADRESPGALDPVAGQEWDAVVDLTSQPGQAASAAATLRTRHAVYVSSTSVYRRDDVCEQPEDFPTHAALDAAVMADASQYGAAKVACENSWRQVGATIVRPGLIGGDGDWTGRTGYYPWRFAHPTGADVLVPDDTFPAAILDVADLAAWIVHCAAERVEGTFNANGATTTLAEVYRISRDLAAGTSSTGAGAGPQVRVVDDATLEREGVGAWVGPRSLPLWVPGAENRYLSTADTTAARARGLSLRPLEQTLAAVARYEETREVPRRAGLSDEEERALRAAIEESR